MVGTKLSGNARANRALKQAPNAYGMKYPSLVSKFGTSKYSRLYKTRTYAEPETELETFIDRIPPSNFSDMIMAPKDQDPILIGFGPISKGGISFDMILEPGRTFYFNVAKNDTTSPDWGWNKQVYTIACDSLCDPNSTNGNNDDIYIKSGTHNIALEFSESEQKIYVDKQLVLTTTLTNFGPIKGFNPYSLDNTQYYNNIYIENDGKQVFFLDVGEYEGARPIYVSTIADFPLTPWDNNSSLIADIQIVKV